MLFKNGKQSQLFYQHTDYVILLTYKESNHIKGNNMDHNHVSSYIICGIVVAIIHADVLIVTFYKL